MAAHPVRLVPFILIGISLVGRYTVATVDVPADTYLSKEHDERNKDRRGSRQLQWRPFQRFSLGELGCQHDLSVCRRHHEPGSFSMDGWRDLLPNDGDPSNIVSHLRLILDTTDYVIDQMPRLYQEMSAMSAKEISTQMSVLSDTSAKLEEFKEDVVDLSKGDIVENSEKIKFAWERWNYYLGELISVQLGLEGEVEQLVTQVLLPIWLIVGLPINVVGASALLLWLRMVDFIAQLRRAYTGWFRIRSSPECEAELTACRYEELLAEVMPSLITQAFLDSSTFHNP